MFYNTEDTVNKIFLSVKLRILVFTFVLGAQKNRLDETLFLSTHKPMFWLMNKRMDFQLHTLT